MRPYRVDDDSYDDDHPRVVPIRGGGRGRSNAPSGRGRPEPWTPRDMTLPASARRAEPPPSSTGSSRAHRWMIGGFLVICAGMIIGVVMVRLWDEASRAVAALPPEGASPAARQAPATPLPTPVPETPVASAPASGGITTEIRVLQPNYTVAPGDTLGSIARRHGTSVEALASINNLENRNSLSIGQKLIIP